ncbi:LysM peptidoglycan-binding domain-containing protein [Candidatus Parcubacteria bacterium]|nr:LysM peptidoglycan-binding domain-containing protein [Patescibacteria group bacterium]MCG2688931.1 LysM peptidoglycan-binding domain-containing protein [Candidatus Parcubacteria bacterium]
MSSQESTTNKVVNPMPAIFAGIIVVLAGFAVYNYFNSSKNQDNSKGEITQEALSQAGRTEEKNSKLPEVLGVGGAETPERPIVWYANDYKSGDITSGEYTVKEGDTLWEIAEAKYGSGFEWNKILTANSKSIGWLANGNPLIEPGQVLVLPN